MLVLSFKVWISGVLVLRGVEVCSFKVRESAALVFPAAERVAMFSRAIGLPFVRVLAPA